jgi:acyl carrier protein
MSDLKERLLSVLLDSLRAENVPTEGIDAHTHLFQEARIDSLQLISFLLAAEVELEAPIDFESLDFNDLSSIDRLATVLEEARLGESA